MNALVFLVCLAAQSAPAAEPVANPKPSTNLDPLRKMYREDADKYQFHCKPETSPALELVPQPIMRWATDDDWSGDVFLWTYEQRPAIVGCILSGPGNETQRLVFHEFHLLSDQQLAPTQLQTNKRWQPKSSLEVQLVPNAPAPARTAAGRLTQMRQLSRQFTAHMRADSNWELRGLPQPLHRYSTDGKEGVDGALFAYVWSKGTDPEVILLLECRRTKTGEEAWHYAPVRFSTRSVWLQYEGKEVWRVETHHEPEANATDMIYTTAYARTTARPDDQPSAKPEPSK